MDRTKEYFRHDYGTRQDENIIRLIFNMGWEGYGLYWAIVELIYAGKGKLKADFILLSHELRIDAKKVEDIVLNHGLFYIKDGNIRSKCIDNRLLERSGLSEKRRAAIANRWLYKSKNTPKSGLYKNFLVGEQKEKVGENDTNSPMKQADTNVLQMNQVCNTRIEQNRIEQNSIDSKKKPHTKDKSNRGVKYPYWLDSALWAKFLTVRRAKGKVVDDAIEELLIKKLSGFMRNGCDPSQVLEIAILGNYADLYDIPVEKRRPFHIKSAYELKVERETAKSEAAMTPEQKAANMARYTEIMKKLDDI